eukprot:8967775-Pyramimonas_sp.AAC.1
MATRLPAPTRLHCHKTDAVVGEVVAAALHCTRRSLPLAALEACSNLSLAALIVGLAFLLGSWPTGGSAVGAAAAAPL